MRDNVAGTWREPRFTVGDGRNGVRMGEGEKVYALADDGSKFYLGIIRIDGGMPYLNYENEDEG